jgi:hypothetical protein
VEIENRTETPLRACLIDHIVFMGAKVDKLRSPFKNQQDVDIVWFLFTRYQTPC